MAAELPPPISLRSWQAAASLFGLLILSSLIYSPVRHFGFLDYDDWTYVLHNAYIQGGFSFDSLRYAFTASFGGWSPLVWISFLIDRQLFSATPSALHIENVAMHIIGGAMLWLLLTKITSSPGRSWIVAGLFLCHPMHVESVAWISERKDVLSTPLLFGAILAYWQYCQQPARTQRWVYYCLMLSLFALSLMAKAMGVSLPLLLLLLDYWPMKRFSIVSLADPKFRLLCMDKLPLVAITVIFAIVAMFTQRASGATAAAVYLPLIDRIDNAIVCYIIYAIKLVIPLGLAAFYPHPGARPVASVIAAGTLLAFVSWLAIRQRTRAPYFIVGWFWFLVSLLPVIGLVQIGGQAMADRYSYLPSIGLFIAIVWGISDLGSKLNLRYKNPVLLATSVTVIVMFSLIARRQVWYWEDLETLFVHSYNVTGPNPVACFMMGEAAYNRGDTHSAVDDFDAVIEQDPGNDRAQKYLGDLWADSNIDKAIDYYEAAITLKPEKAIYRISLAAALTRKGSKTSLELAEQQLQSVLRIDPTNSQALAGLPDVRARLHLKAPQ